jgi:flagellar biosynthesis/type III secretory pathway protein FliH
LVVVVVNMKSLPNIIRPQDGQAISSWMPDLLQAPQVPVPEAQLDELISLFGLATDKKKGDPSPGSSHLFRAGQGTNPDLGAWAPVAIDDLEPLAVFEEWDISYSSQPEPELVKEPVVSEPPELSAAQKLEEEVQATLADARRQAEEIILEAQRTADQVLQQAEAEAQELTANGYSQGWDKARQEAASLLKAGSAMIDELKQWRNQILDQSESEIQTIIRQIATLLFGEGVHLDENALQVYLNQVLEDAKSMGDVSIYMSPADAGLLDSSWPEYQSLIRGEKVRIIPSPRIKPGGCYVQGQMGIVDAQVETKLKAVWDAMAETEEQESKND